MSRSSQAAAGHCLVASHHPLCSSSVDGLAGSSPLGTVTASTMKSSGGKKKGTVVCAVQMLHDCIRIWHECGRLGNHTHASAFKGLQKIPFAVCKALDVAYHTPRYCEISPGDSGAWSPWHAPGCRHWDTRSPPARCCLGELVSPSTRRWRTARPTCHQERGAIQCQLFLSWPCSRKTRSH